jgi:cell wall-associated NlpC family hydrolase
VRRTSGTGRVTRPKRVLAAVILAASGVTVAALVLPSATSASSVPSRPTTLVVSTMTVESPAGSAVPSAASTVHGLTSSSGATTTSTSTTSTSTSTSTTSTSTTSTSTTSTTSTTTTTVPSSTTTTTVPSAHHHKPVVSHNHKVHVKPVKVPPTTPSKPPAKAASPKPTPAPTTGAPTGPTSHKYTTPLPKATPAPSLPVLRRVMIVSDAGDQPTIADLTTLLRKAGVEVGAANIEIHSQPVVAPDLPAVLDADVKIFHPNETIVALPSADVAGMQRVITSFPKGLSVLWAQDPSGRAVTSIKLGRAASRLLTKDHHLTIVSPGAVLSGTPNVVRDGHLTKAGVKSYAESLLDVVGASYRLPRLPASAAESPDAAGYVAVAAAESRLGDPYIWAAAGPDSFDCSGLVMWAWAHAGVSLPHYSGSQFDLTTRVPMDALEPGDLLFPSDPGEHVAMYVGDGKIIQAPEPGEDVEIVTLASTGNFFKYATQVTFNGVVGQMSVGSIQTYALGIVRSTPGWGVGQWPYLDLLWNRESGWQVDATNPTSGAYGIAQALPAIKMDTAGADWLSNPQTQVRWGLGYIQARYGTPEKAWAHELTYGWY